jgi:predicted phosphate transport protein (TIGR00153 family)
MALNLFSRLMPREEAFTALFCEQTKYVVEASRKLKSLVDGDGAIDAHVGEIRGIEAAADAVARKIFMAANRTFNAPIDREDILALAHDLDDVVDLIEDTSRGIQRYDVREFPHEMRQMADAVVRSGEVLEQVMPLLDAITPQYKSIFALCERIGQIEGEADECLDLGLLHVRAQLRAGEIDTIAYIDRKEIYELLEQVVDKCDDVANTLQAITAKHV